MHAYATTNGIYICYGDGGAEEVVERVGEAAEEGLVELERGLAVEHGEVVDGEGEAPVVSAPGSVGEEDLGVVGGDAADPGRQRGDAGAGRAVVDQWTRKSCLLLSLGSY